MHSTRDPCLRMVSIANSHSDWNAHRTTMGQNHVKCIVISSSNLSKLKPCVCSFFNHSHVQQMTNSISLQPNNFWRNKWSWLYCNYYFCWQIWTAYSNLAAKNDPLHLAARPPWGKRSFWSADGQQERCHVDRSPWSTTDRRPLLYKMFLHKKWTS